MAQRMIVTMSCDVCERADDTVKTHKIKIDSMRKPKVLEACSQCWPDDTLEKLLAVGRIETPD